MNGNVVAIIGSQWGDEGKGKLIDLLSGQAQICARYNGGSNAGHTIKVGQDKFAFHLLPSGILYPSVTCLIGNGVVFHIPSFLEELKQLDAFSAKNEDKRIDYSGRILLSNRCHIVFDFHRIVDGLRESRAQGTKEFIGTTKQGIGPSYSTKMARTSLRMGDLLHFDTFPARLQRLVDDAKMAYGDFEYDVAAEVERYRGYAQLLKSMIVDSVVYINKAINAGKKVLVEGANASMLDIDFGTYPYVTSSSPSIGGACTGLGIPPNKIQQVIAIVKAYSTRVGAGPFVTEDFGPDGEGMRVRGHEYGTTTGRPRRCGWLDMVQLQYTHMINGFTDVAITKLDILSGLKEIKVCVQYKDQIGNILESVPAQIEVLEQVQPVYETLPGWDEDISSARTFEDLPVNAQKYVKYIEEKLNCHVTWIGVGPERDAIIIIPQ